MKFLYRSSVVSFIFLLSLGFANPIFAQEFITNGSLTGQIALGTVPDGWTILSGSPDTNDENNNVGGAGCTFGTNPSGPSPDGGTWVGYARSEGDFTEIFGQTVTGLTIGQEYELSWYAGNFGGGSCGYNGDNAIVVSLDGSVEGAGGSLSQDSAWVSQSITFTATSVTHDIAFGLAEAVSAYLSIDGISLMASDPSPSPPPQPVPTISELAIFFLVALMGLIGLRRVRESS